MKNFIITLLLALTGLFVSCSSNNVEQEAITPPASISLSKDKLEFDSNEDYQTVNITASSEWTISGGASWCDISPDKGKGNQTVTITVKNNENSEDRTTEITFRCGSATAKLSVVQYGKFDTDYVDMKLEEEGVTTLFDESTGQVTIEYKGITPPSIEEGKSIVLPTEYEHGIRVVNSVKVSGNTVVLGTEQGSMANLFRNMEFTLTTNPDLVSKSRSTGRVITPVSIEAIDEKGNNVLIYSRKNIPDSRLDIYGSVTNELLTFHKNLSGRTLYSGSYGSIEWNGLDINANLNLVMSFVWGEMDLLKLKMGELTSYGVSLDGNLDISMILAYLLDKEATIGEEDVVLKNIASFAINFTVGPVPVHINIDVDLKKDLYVTSTGSVAITTGGDYQANGSIGMQWTKSGGVSPVYSYVPNYHFYKPGFKVNGSLEGRASFYPELDFRIYDLLGPWFTLKPYAEATFEGSYEKEIGENPEFGWKFESGVGLEGQMGLNLEFAFLSEDIGIWESETKTFFEKTLYEAPTKIEVDPALKDTEMEVGKEMEVKFNVSGKNLLTDEDVPCPTALIELETEGELAGNPEKPTVTSDEDGVVKVMWTPQDEKHKLKAKVLDKEKNIITEATFSPNRKNTEREALRLLYESTYGDNWKDTTNWLSPVHISEWFGVTDYSELGESVKEECKAQNNFPSFYTGSEEMVVDINLENNNLTGDALVSGFSFLKGMRLGEKLNSLTFDNCAIASRFDLMGLAKSDLKELNISNIQFNETEIKPRSWFYIEDYYHAQGSPKPPIHIKEVNISNFKQSYLSIDAINLISEKVNISDFFGPAAFNLRGGEISSLKVQEGDGLIVIDDCSVKSFDYSGCGLIHLDKFSCDKATIKNAEHLYGNGYVSKLTVDACNSVVLDDLSSCDKAIIKNTELFETSGSIGILTADSCSNVILSKLSSCDKATIKNVQWVTVGNAKDVEILDCEGRTSILGKADNVTITNSGGVIIIGGEASCDNATITNSGDVSISRNATIGTLIIDLCKFCSVRGHVNRLIIRNYNGSSPWSSNIIPTVTIENCTIRNVYIASMSGSSASIDNYINEVLESRENN